MPNFIDDFWSRHHARWNDRLITRFPPEPNGHLHLGHAKSIALNFGLAKAHGGTCHLRLDDTNPAKEDPAFAEGIKAMVTWLGFTWDGEVRHASDHFDALYAAACSLIDRGLAYVDHADAATVRERRGSLTRPGTNSPERDLPPAHHRAAFERMRTGEEPEGSCTLRAKIDMASPNLNLRDPVLYRIKHVAHDRTGNAWCIYPSYDFAHPFCDAMGGIALSLCTLEFEDHRPLYEWVLRHCEGFFTSAGASAPPEELEFARLELDRGITSKRNVARGIDSGDLDGWDDPRLVTLLGLRRRGFTPESILRFCDVIGVSKANSVVPFERLEECLREVLGPVAPRRILVVDPVPLDVADAGAPTVVDAPNHPKDPSMGTRPFTVSNAWWIARDDVRAAGAAEPGFKRLTPGAVVRLMHGYVVRVDAVDTDTNGRPMAVRATRVDDAKPKATVHALDRRHAVPVTVDEVDVLPSPDADPGLFRTRYAAFAEPALLNDDVNARVHAVRYGYGRWDPNAPTGEHRWIRTVGLKSGFKPMPGR